jgi:5'-nucleotidase
MKVLITNDDGIAAPGIRALALALQPHADVVVAAPAQESSGASAALNAVFDQQRLAITRHTLSDVDVEAYKVLASPAYIAILASLGTFGSRPDVVLSGINRGANAGHAVIHSGTVGAALTAANHGLPAMAVSLDVLPAGAGDPATGGASLADYLGSLADDTLHWSTAGDVAVGLLDRLAGLPSGVAINVNVPNAARSDLKGVRTASLAPFGQVQMAIAELGQDFVRTAIERSGDRLEPGTDLALLADGYATVTAICSVRVADLAIAL